jgi:flagellar hook assembly protein FlgD
VPRTFSLDQNYPNPFNPSTAIPVSLPVRANIELKVYNILGQEVKTLHSGVLEAGRHVFLWDGTNSAGSAVASGVYISRLTSDNGVRLGKKMLLLR